MSSLVFLVDDDASVRRSLDRLFRVAGHTVEAFAQAADFLKRLPFDGEACECPRCLASLCMQQAVRACHWLQVALRIHQGHGEVADAVLAMKGGALDYLRRRKGASPSACGDG